MAYTFPMPLAQFFGKIPIQVAEPTLSDALEYSQTGAGEILTADMGPRLWRMNVNVRLGYYAEIEKVKAKLDVLRHAGRSLLVHSMPLVAPQSDPTGSILGANVVTLTSVNVNNREINLEGLPAGYVLEEGDFLSWTYGANPLRYAMHQVAADAVANGDGVMTNLELSTFVREGVVSGAVVTLIKPLFKAVVLPGSVSGGSSGAMITQGVKFTLIQTLR